MKNLKLFTISWNKIENNQDGPNHRLNCETIKIKHLRIFSLEGTKLWFDDNRFKENDYINEINKIDLARLSKVEKAPNNRCDTYKPT